MYRAFIAVTATAAFALTACGTPSGPNTTDNTQPPVKISVAPAPNGLPPEELSKPLPTITNRESVEPAMRRTVDLAAKHTPFVPPTLRVPQVLTVDGDVCNLPFSAASCPDLEGKFGVTLYLNPNRAWETFNNDGEIPGNFEMQKATLNAYVTYVAEHMAVQRERTVRIGEEAPDSEELRTQLRACISGSVYAALGSTMSSPLKDYWVLPESGMYRPFFDKGMYQNC